LAKAEAVRVRERARAVPDRILVVEDEAIVAMLLEDMLAELGYEVVGPVTRLDRALVLARDAPIDAAVLDVNLNGRDTYAVADALSARAIPFVFATGYGAKELAERFRGTPITQKPFHRDDLERALRVARSAQSA
jgi:CheY-like chemotaxis protein